MSILDHYGQEKERYGCHLEYPYNPEINLREQEDMHENLKYEQLLEMLNLHLGWPLTSVDWKS